MARVVAFKRYSPKALDRVIKELPKLDMDDIWARRRAGAKRTA